MNNNYIFKHFNLTYINNKDFCNCLLSFFLNPSNILLQEMLFVTKYSNEDAFCLTDLIQDKDNHIINIIWVKVSPFIEKEQKHAYIHSNVLRMRSGLDKHTLNYNYKENIYNYNLKLIQEMLQYCLHRDIESLFIFHEAYYKPFWDKNSLRKSMTLQDKKDFFKYINPLFSFNYLNLNKIYIECMLKKNLKVFFIPDIGNIFTTLINKENEIS